MREIFVKPNVSVQRSLNPLFQRPFLCCSLFLRVCQVPGQDQQNGKHSVNNHTYPSEIASKIYRFIFL